MLRKVLPRLEDEIDRFVEFGLWIGSAGVAGVFNVFARVPGDDARFA